MRQLAWKEFRENRAVLLQMLLLPLGILVLFGLLAGSHAFRTVGRGGGLVLAIVATFVLFPYWGATRMPHEREAGSLSLRMLPVRAWPVWLAKFVSGIVCALIYAALTCCLAMVVMHEPFPLAKVIWMLAGAFASAYAISFTLSLFFSSQTSWVTGIFTSAALWAALASLRSQLGLSDSIFFTPWILTAVLGVFAFWVIRSPSLKLTVSTPRDKGASSWANRIVIAVATALVVILVAVLIASQFVPEYRTRQQFFANAQVADQQLVVCPGPDFFAQASAGDSDMQLKVYSGDRKHERLVASGTHLAPLAWTSDRRLIYLSRAFGLRQMQLMLWDPRTGHSVQLSTMDAIRDELREYPTPISVAVEPGGNRIAFVRTKLGLDVQRDLWVKNLRTGEQRLIAANIGDYEVLWRAGRIYLRSEDLMVVSPDGGRPEVAHRLPAPSMEEAR